MKVVKLEIDENSILEGVDAVALVESPAIEEGFFAFNAAKFAETYTDYPEGAVTAAKQGIKRNEETGNKCATQVGKVRAQQLANREPISLDTVRRMRAFLIRQKDNYELARDRKDYEACGYISYLLWGGPAALSWSEKTLRQAGEEFVKQEYEGLEDACQEGYIAYGLKRKNGRLVPNCIPKQQFEKQILEGIIASEFELLVGELPDYSNEPTGSIEVSESSYAFSVDAEKQMLIGPLMTPGKLIARKDENGDPYYVYFTEDTIKKIAYKAMEDKIIDKVNIEHDNSNKVDNAFLVETWIVDNPEADKSTEYGFTPKVGQWFGAYRIKDKAVWDEYVKSGKVKGFSVEGYFSEKIIKANETLI